MALRQKKVYQIRGIYAIFKDMIICIGETVIDYIGNKALIGGSILNTAKAAARQGVPVSYLSEISSDDNGKAVLEDLIDNCIMFEPSMCSSSFSTMTAKAVQTENGVTYSFSIDNSTAVNISSAKLIDAFKTNSDIDCVALGSITFADKNSRNEMLKAIETLNDVFIYFDPNCRPSLIKDKQEYVKAVRDFAPRCDIFKCSDEDLAYMGFTEESLLEIVKGSLIITYGKKGATWYRRGCKPIHRDIFEAKVFKDTVGCGDTFNGNILACLQRDRSFRTISEKEMEKYLTRASMASSLNCEKEGCNPPTEKELNLALERAGF